jgi:ferrous iron transport protein B
MSEPARAEVSAPKATPQPERLVALAGNPNVGKTTVFNGLTRLRQKVANYPGVTVERKTGSMVGPDGMPITIIDVPGTYSLNPTSLDEEVAYRVLIGAIEGSRRPDLVVCLVDAGNLERNLYLASQILDLGRPTIIALNMVDAAEGAGIQVDARKLSKELGVPVIPMVASRGQGIEELRAALCGPLPIPARRGWNLDSRVEEKTAALAHRLERDLPALSPRQRFSDALRALTQRGASFFEVHHTPTFWAEVRKAREELESAGVSSEQAEVVGRYEWITPLAERVVDRSAASKVTLTDRIDAVLTHRIAGPILFFLILAVIFQSVFAWATPFMDAIDGATARLGDWVSASLPEGPIRGLLVDGVIAGVGAVVIFLPQILILFFFLGLLEDTGYMARAAFIMDRIMKRVGLSGRSVVPLLPHHRQPARPTRNDPGHAAHDLLGAASGLRAAHRRLHPGRQPLRFPRLPGPNASRALPARNRVRRVRCLGAQALLDQGRALCVHHGAPPLPPAASAGRGMAHGGAEQALPDPGGDDHLCGRGGPLVPRDLPPARAQARDRGDAG